MTTVQPNNVKIAFNGRAPKRPATNKAKKLQAKGLISERQMRRIGARS